MSGGWTPMVHLFTQSGGKLKFNDKDYIFIPDMNKSPTDQISVGSCNGNFELDDLISNTIKNIKIFLDLDKTIYDNLNVVCSKESEKRRHGYDENYTDLITNKGSELLPYIIKAIDEIVSALNEQTQKPGIGDA